jgi:iron complex outermembrane receptor protein
VTASYFDDIQTISLSAYGGPQEDGLAFYGISKSQNSDESARKYNYGATSRDREVLNQPQISLVHDLRLGSDLWLKNTFFFMSGDGFFDFNANYGDNNYFRLDPSIQIPSDIMMRAFVDNDQFGWIPQIEYNYGAGKLLAGGEVRIHRSLHWGRIESGRGLPEDVVGEKGNKHFYEYEGGKNVYSTFVSISHPFTEKLNVIAKLQAIYQQYLLNNEKFVGTDLKTSYFFVNPQVGVNYTISKSFSIYGSVSYTHREPPLKNLYEAESASWGVVPQFEKNGDGSYNFDKPFVKPEVLTNLELGTRIVLQKFIGSVNFYYMDFQNEIVPSGGLDVFGQPRVGNADKTLHYGIELEGAYKLPWNLQFNLNSNFSRNRYVDFKEYDDNGNPVKRNENYIANAPEIILNAGLSYLSDSFFAQVNVNHTGVQYTDNSTHPDGSKIDELTVDHFTVVNMGLGVNFGLQDARLRLSIEVNNLFDNKYLMNGFGWDNFFPSAGRNLMTNLKVEF